MSTLLDTNPRAAEFCESVIANADRYKLCASETFAELLPCVVATTSIDLHGDAFSRAGLEPIVSAVASRPYWLGVQHDPLINPQGRIIAAKIFDDEEKSISFVAGVIGTYDARNFLSFEHVGITNTDREDEFVIEIADQAPEISVACSSVEIDSELVSEWIESSPAIVVKSVRRSIRKELDPVTIVTLLLSGGILVKPFVTKLGEKLGDKAGEDINAVYDWLKNQVFSTFKKIKNDRFRFEFVFEYDGTVVQFVVPSKDEELLYEATENLEQAYALAVRIIQKLKDTVPDKLVLEFDTERRKWRPCHLTTKKLGIISDRPTLGALDKMQGLSVGGIVADDSGATTIPRKTQD